MLTRTIAWKCFATSLTRLNGVRLLSSTNVSWTSSKRNNVELNVTTLPNTKKYPVVDVWTGISDRELAKVTGKLVDDIHEAMILLDIDDLRSFDDVVRVCNGIGFRCRHVKPPSNDQFTTTRGGASSLVPQPLVPKIGKLLKPRPPVVTIMGHVDHGKTTILDSLRRSEIAKNEHGGITQHIGAFVVSLDGAKGPESIKKSLSSRSLSNIQSLVTFLDTPGHAAFHAMRERGANVTDIVVLVVAADDGIMDQTSESIKFAQSANVPIVVAINKIDKVNMNDYKVMDQIKRGLMTHGIVLEEDGGDTQSVKVSGLTGEGLNDLKEAIIALSETKSIQSPIDGDVVASVIESSVDPGRGRLASLLIRSGSLKRGDIICSTSMDQVPSWAKVRSMFDEFGNTIDTIGPGFPVQVIGWKDNHIPIAGDTIVSVASEKSAKDFTISVKNWLTTKKAEIDVIEGRKRYQDIVDEYRRHLQEKRSSNDGKSRFWRFRTDRNDDRFRVHTDDPDIDRKINVILKADVHGSLEVLLDVLTSYPNHREIVKLNVVSYGVGSITENDLEMASIFPNTIIYGFNVKTPPTIFVSAKKSNILIKSFNVIYHLIDDVKSRINERIPEIDHEVPVGEAIVQQEFLINERNKKVPVAGSRCIKGLLRKGKDFLYRQIRGNDVVIDKLVLQSMRHLKDEVDTINKDMDCGLRFSVRQVESDPPLGAIQSTTASSTKNNTNNKSKEEQQLDELLSQVSSSSKVELKFLPVDKLVCFQIEKRRPKTKWSPKGF